jgi:peptidoglycan/xylan/chitin deacetylase (PgdA/CDA1 family)
MKSKIKKFLLYGVESIARLFLVNEFLFRYLIKDLIVVFNYHEINDRPSKFCSDYDLSITPEIFNFQLGWMKRYFNFPSPDDLINNRIKTPAALLTFDDGFFGAVSNGGEIIKKHSLHAIIFVNMGPVDGHLCKSASATYLCRYDNGFKDFIQEKYNIKTTGDYFLYVNDDDVTQYLESNDNNLFNVIKEYHGRFLTDELLRKSKDFGFFLGNHLYNHLNAANISEDEFVSNYEKNQFKLKKYDNFINFFSYPFGQPIRCYNSHTNKVISDLGAQRIFSAIPYFNRDEKGRLLHRTPMFEWIDSEVKFRVQCIIPSLLNHIFRLSYLQMDDEMKNDF